MIAPFLWYIVTADIFGGDDHFVVLTVIDEFGHFRTLLFFNLQRKPSLEILHYLFNKNYVAF